MSCDYELTKGSLKKILMGSEVRDPIMQILGIKKINSGTDKARIRLLLSDGENTISFAMLSTQNNTKIPPGGLENFSVIKVLKYICSTVSSAGKGEARVVLILELDILANGDNVGGTIGSPTALANAIQAQKTNSTPVSTNSLPNSAPSFSSNAPQNKMNNSPQPVGNDSLNCSVLSSQLTQPISSLSPYHNKWVIKGRVTNKSQIRTWSNSRGEGKLFSFEVLDESGEIRCTAFRELVDKFYDYLQVDKVYYISKCQLKPANKQFNSTKNDYEMTCNNETVIQECEEADDNISIPKTKYDFVTIDKIGKMEVGTICDVIGVCSNCSDLVSFQARSTGRELKKKEVTLVDQSGHSVALTLWNAEAESFDGTNSPVVVLKGAKIGEFGGGKNLSTIGSSQIKINPDIVECYRIRGWYDSEGSNISATSISAKSGGAYGTKWLSFKEAQAEVLGASEKGVYYQNLVFLLLIRSDNLVYKACPTDDCNKKLVNMENGMYRCEKCNREYPNFKYRLLASVNFSDDTINVWANMFSTEAEKVLGMTSQEVGEAIEGRTEAANEICEKAHFKKYIVKFRAKMENFNDERSLKTVAIKVDDVNFEEYGKYLVEEIDKMLTMGNDESNGAY